MAKHGLVSALPPVPHHFSLNDLPACSIILSELAHVIKSLGGGRRDIASCFSADAGNSGPQVGAGALIHLLPCGLAASCFLPPFCARLQSPAPLTGLYNAPELVCASSVLVDSQRPFASDGSDGLAVEAGRGLRHRTLFALLLVASPLARSSLLALTHLLPKGAVDLRRTLSVATSGGAAALADRRRAAAASLARHFSAAMLAAVAAAGGAEDELTACGIPRGGLVTLASRVSLAAPAAAARESLLLWSTSVPPQEDQLAFSLGDSPRRNVASSPSEPSWPKTERGELAHPASAALLACAWEDGENSRDAVGGAPSDVTALWSPTPAAQGFGSPADAGSCPRLMPRMLQWAAAVSVPAAPAPSAASPWGPVVRTAVRSSPPSPAPLTQKGSLAPHAPAPVLLALQDRAVSDVGTRARLLSFVAMAAGYGVGTQVYVEALAVGVLEAAVCAGEAEPGALAAVAALLTATARDCDLGEVISRIGVTSTGDFLCISRAAGGGGTELAKVQTRIAALKVRAVSALVARLASLPLSSPNPSQKPASAGGVRTAVEQTLAQLVAPDACLASRPTGRSAAGGGGGAADERPPPPSAHLAMSFAQYVDTTLILQHKALPGSVPVLKRDALVSVLPVLALPRCIDCSAALPPAWAPHSPVSALKPLLSVSKPAAVAPSAALVAAFAADVRRVTWPSIHLADALLQAAGHAIDAIGNISVLFACIALLPRLPTAMPWHSAQARRLPRDAAKYLVPSLLWSTPLDLEHAPPCASSETSDETPVVSGASTHFDATCTVLRCMLDALCLSDASRCDCAGRSASTDATVPASSCEVAEVVDMLRSLDFRQVSEPLCAMADPLPPPLPLEEPATPDANSEVILIPAIPLPVVGGVGILPLKLVELGIRPALSTATRLRAPSSSLLEQPDAAMIHDLRELLTFDDLRDADNAPSASLVSRAAQVARNLDSAALSSRSSDWSPLPLPGDRTDELRHGTVPLRGILYSTSPSPRSPPLSSACTEEGDLIAPLRLAPHTDESVAPRLPPGALRSPSTLSLASDSFVHGPTPMSVRPPASDMAVPSFPSICASPWHPTPAVELKAPIPSRALFTSVDLIELVPWAGVRTEEPRRESHGGQQHASPPRSARLPLQPETPPRPTPPRSHSHSRQLPLRRQLYPWSPLRQLPTPGDPDWLHVSPSPNHYVGPRQSLHPEQGFSGMPASNPAPRFDDCAGCGGCASCHSPRPLLFSSPAVSTPGVRASASPSGAALWELGSQGGQSTPSHSRLQESSTHWDALEPWQLQRGSRGAYDAPTLSDVMAVVEQQRQVLENQATLLHQRRQIEEQHNVLQQHMCGASSRLSPRDGSVVFSGGPSAPTSFPALRLCP